MKAFSRLCPVINGLLFFSVHFELRGGCVVICIRRIRSLVEVVLAGRRRSCLMEHRRLRLLRILGFLEGNRRRGTLRLLEGIVLKVTL